MPRSANVDCIHLRELLVLFRSVHLTLCKVTRITWINLVVAVKQRLANARLEPPTSRMGLSNVTWQGPLIAGKRQLARCRETRPSVIISNHRVRPYSSGGSSSKYRRLGKAWLSMLAGPCLITGCGAATDYSDPPWAWLTE
jgi:hypothetical protein